MSGKKFSGTNKRRNGHRRNPRALACQMCKRPTKGSLKKWNKLLVCGRCYKTLCRRFISGNNLRKKVLRSLSPPKPKPRGLISWLFS